MVSKVRWSTSSIVIVTLLLFLAGIASAGEIDAQLADKLATMGPDEFVRVIIRMEEQPFVSRAMGADTVRFVLQETAQRTQAPVLQYLESGQADGDVKAFNSFWIVNVAFAEIRADKVRQLAELPGVARVFEDFQLSLPPREMRPLVEAQQLRWDHVAAVFAPDVWELGIQGQGITVAVADTGVDIEHPELAGAMGGAGPFHEGYWAEFDEDGHIVPGSMPHDTDDHGTHVSGTVAARNIEYQIGVAPQVTIAHALVIPEGSGSFPQVLGGFQWVAEQKFDVINGSFGANSIIPEMAEATDNLAAMGVVPVFSNGNISPLDPINLPPGAPGNTPAAIGVGAYDSNGDEPSFNRGDIIEYPGYDYDEFTRIKPDISAPGVDIYSTVPGGGYRYAAGTSMSSPHVAGVVALMLSANPDLTVDEVKEVLYSTTGGHEETHGWDDIPTKDIHFGWGRVNALRAVQEVMPGGVFVKVAGTVVAENKPLADATVTFAGPVTKVFTTDQNGHYEGELEEGYYTVTAAAEGYLSETRQVTVINTGSVIENYFILQQAPKGHVVGTVRDAETAALLSGVTVEAIEYGLTSQTDEDGSYALSLSEGLVSLRFSLPGYFDFVVDNVPVVPEHTAQIDAELSFGFRTLTGIVTDIDGQPLADVTVRVVETDDLQTTGDGGTFVFDLPAGEYDIEVQKVGFVATRIPAQVATGQVTHLELQLVEAVGSLTGVVTSLGTDESPGAPLADAFVTIPTLDLETVTDEDGRYVLESVPAGRWRVHVEHHEHYSQQATVDIVVDSTTTLDVVLQPYGGLSPFRNSFDTVAERSVWEFIDYSGSDVQWHFTDLRSVSEPFSAWNGYVDEQGRLTYPANQAVGLVSPPIDIPEEAQGTMLMTFQLRGLIWGSTTQFFAVFVKDVETDEENLVYVYDLLIGSENWFEVAVDMTPYAGRTITVEFYFQSNTNVCVTCGDEGMFIDDILIGYVDPEFDSMVTGVVEDEQGRPVADATVTVVEMGASGDFVRLSQAMTDAEGRYEVVVPGGGWTMRAAKAPEFVSAEQMVYVEPGGVATADFVLSTNRPPAAVTGLEAFAGDSTVQLHWDAVDEDDIAGYNVYRSLNGEHFNIIGRTTNTHFAAEGLQNGYTYFFRVAAVDVHGLEGEHAEVSAIPSEQGPKVGVFDVAPRTLPRGGALSVQAQLDHATDKDALLDVRLQAALGDETIREWEFSQQPLGTFAAVVDTVDVFGKPWAPNVYRMTLFVTDDAGRVATSNTINVAVLAPLPRALSFLLGNNPFNPSSESQSLEYAVPADGHVHVAVYTLDGRQVRTLVDEPHNAGRYVAYWDGTGSDGRVVLAGMYVVRVRFTDDDGQRTDLTRHSVVVK